MANAFEIPGFSFTLNAATDIAWHRFVKVNSDGKAVAATAATDPIIGVSYNDAAATQPLTIHADGIVFVEAGATIAAGAGVTAGTDGKAVSGTSFIAITGGNAGDTISVLLNHSTGTTGSTGATGGTGM